MRSLVQNQKCIYSIVFINETPGSVTIGHWYLINYISDDKLINYLTK